MSELEALIKAVRRYLAAEEVARNEWVSELDLKELKEARKVLDECLQVTPTK